MENLIKNNISKPLSNKEILQLVNGKANLVSYANIHKYNNLDQLLGQYNACICLYETRKNYGHWCCILKLDDDKIEFFDPYGIMPDQELSWINKDFRIQSRQDKPYLSILMRNSNYVLSYNHHRFQKFKKGINTCGRWCALRILFRMMPLNIFIQVFGKKREYDNDFYATLLTNYI
jgi:hypothetical protein